ncbi:hypothetical protein BOX15_Mlig005851g2, partial [Macrostomum lignano]
PRRLLSWRRFCWRRQLASTAGPETNNSNGTGGPATVKTASEYLQHLGPLSETLVTSDAWLHRAIYTGVQFKLRYYLSPVPAKKHQSQHALFLLLAPFGRGYSEVETLGRYLEEAGQRVLLPLWPGLGSPGHSAKDERVFSYSAAENSILLCRLLRNRALRSMPNRPVLVVASGQACWPAVAMATLAPELLSGAVLTAPSDPDPLQKWSALRLLADLTAGLWSHSVLRVLPAAAIAACSPLVNWPPLIGRQWLRLRAYHLLGLRHRDSDNGRSLAVAMRCSPMHLTALAKDSRRLQLLLSEEPIEWSGSALQLLPAKRLSVSGWPYPVGCYGNDNADYRQFADYLVRMAGYCARSAAVTSVANTGNLLDRAGSLASESAARRRTAAV